MRKYLSLILILITLTPQLLLCEVDKKSKELEKVDKEIVLLESDLKMLRAKALETRLESYHLMIHDWEKYSEAVKKSERYSETAGRLEKRLDELRERRKKLITQNGESPA